MAFDNAHFIEKLNKLTSAATSIETLSQWCIWHRKSHRKIVESWEAELRKADNKRKLAFIFLGNDIVQNSRKKGPEFVHSFARVLPQAVRHTAKHGDENVSKSIAKMISVWEERRVFGSGKVIQDIKEAFGAARKQAGPAVARSTPRDPASAVAAAFADTAAAAKAASASRVPDQERVEALVASSSLAEVAASVAAARDSCDVLAAVVQQRQKLIDALSQAKAAQEGLLAGEQSQAARAADALSKLRQAEQKLQGTAPGAAGVGAAEAAGEGDDDDAYDPNNALWAEDDAAGLLGEVGGAIAASAAPPSSAS